MCYYNYVNILLCVASVISIDSGTYLTLVSISWQFDMMMFKSFCRIKLFLSYHMRKRRSKLSYMTYAYQTKLYNMGSFKFIMISSHAATYLAIISIRHLWSYPA